MASSSRACERVPTPQDADPAHAAALAAPEMSGGAGKGNPRTRVTAVSRRPARTSCVGDVHARQQAASSLRPGSRTPESRRGPCRRGECRLRWRRSRCRSPAWSPPRRRRPPRPRSRGRATAAGRHRRRATFGGTGTASGHEELELPERRQHVGSRTRAVRCLRTTAARRGARPDPADAGRPPWLRAADGRRGECPQSGGRRRDPPRREVAAAGSRAHKRPRSAPRPSRGAGARREAWR